MLDSTGQYLKEIGRFKLLDRAEELELSRQVQTAIALRTLLKEAKPTLEQEAILAAGDYAKAKMIRHNLRLVAANAVKYRNRGVDFLDLVQEGAIGLNRAAEKFDPSLGCKFSTYATAWIKQRITRLIAQDRAIRLPSHINEKLSTMKRVTAQLSQKLGRSPSRKELSEAMGLKDGELEKILDVSRPIVSLDYQASNDEDNILYFIPSDEDVWQLTMANDIKAQVERLLLRANLTDRERDVIWMRIVEGQSFRSVGESLSLSRERIRQIEEKAMKKLRRVAGLD